jgi:formate-dependent phosphoribosylglycinamide formyltransferase (GAR transformylase)
MRADAEPPTRPNGFQVLARRWVVERTIAWLTTNLRLAEDYERLIEASEMLLYLTMNRILLRRLTRKERQLLTSPLFTCATFACRAALDRVRPRKP